MSDTIYVIMDESAVLMASTEATDIDRVITEYSTNPMFEPRTHFVSIQEWENGDCPRVQIYEFNGTDLFFVKTLYAGTFATDYEGGIL
jgi:hypothetical protein